MSSKRKIAASASAASDNDPAPASKKRKLPIAEDETAEGTTKTGLALVNQLNNSRDKQGWRITTHFLKSPERKENPEYYERIGLPMCLETIEAKLNNGEYPNMDSVDGDFRRMISNAKSYNEKRSQVFSDSEKIRKIVSRYMEEHNPAYRLPNHVPITTPVPPDWKEKLAEQKAAEEEAAKVENNVDMTEDTKPQVKQPRLVTHVGSSTAANDRRASSTPAVQDAEGAFQSFEGNTFQEAQEKIMTELISLKDDNSEPAFAPFINLPSRQIIEYYRVIKNPVSLKSVQKAVRGVKGRDKPTGFTFLKSWAAFEEAASHIWENARTFNEDGSDISVLATELEEYFHRRLAEAKRVVQEPPQPRVKLRMPAKSPEPSKITLKFGGGQKNSGTPAMSVDSEALKRQQDLVRAGANGHATGPRMTTNHGKPFIERGVPASQAPNGLKAETNHAQSPALTSIQLNGATDTRQSPGIGSAHMPPPVNMPTRVPSGSPHPQSYFTNANSTSSNSTTSFNSRSRPSGKGILDALITNLNIRSHDGLRVKEHFNLDIPASPTRTQQSVTITIPSTHYYLSITPTVSASLMHRPSKTIVTCSNQSNPSNPKLQPVQQKGEPDPRRPVYETRVPPGVSVIEVEIMAGPPRGAPKVGAGQEIDFERFTVYVHVQKT